MDLQDDEIETNSNESNIDESEASDELLNEWNFDESFSSYNYKDKPAYLKNKSIKPFAVQILASRNTGKSYLAQHLLKTKFKGKFDLICIFSNTIGSGFYDFIESDLKFHSFEPEILAELIEEVDSVKEEFGTYPNTLVIFDDCNGKKVKNSEDIERLFTLGRHKGISILFISQAAKFSNSSWRSNTTHLFLLQMKGTSLDFAKENYLDDLIDKDDIPEGMKITTRDYLQKVIKWVFSEKYRMIVVEYEKTCNNFYDNVKFWKVE